MEASEQCAGCGASFHCGRDEGRRCWCAELPPLTPVPGRGCLCRACLQCEIRKQAELKERSAPDPRS
ncbi:MAG TPA: cysteine-rich CWC family protein [Burkholderiales bacterium]